MAFTARLPAPLQEEAAAYAEKLGISLAALLAVALRDYLDARRPVPLVDGVAVEPPVVVPTPAAAVVKVAEPALSFRPPKSRADPCPCGARDLHDRPVKFKHCHGKLP